MIRPEDCGPLSESLLALVDEAEANISAQLQELYDPRLPATVALDGYANAYGRLRRMGNQRAMQELFRRLENAGWEIHSATDAEDGYPILSVIGKPFEQQTPENVPSDTPRMDQVTLRLRYGPLVESIAERGRQLERELNALKSERT